MANLKHEDAQVALTKKENEAIIGRPTFANDLSKTFSNKHAETNFNLFLITVQKFNQNFVQDLLTLFKLLTEIYQTSSQNTQDTKKVTLTSTDCQVLQNFLATLKSNKNFTTSSSINASHLATSINKIKLNSEDLLKSVDSQNSESSAVSKIFKKSSKEPVLIIAELKNNIYEILKEQFEEYKNSELFARYQFKFFSQPASK